MSPTATVSEARSLVHATAYGDVVLRCLTPADAHHMADLVDRMSPHSRYLRYFRLMSSFPPSDIERFVAAGPHHRAVGAFDDGALVGVAQYFRSATWPGHAEIALEVADTHHRRGVGTALVETLARIAVDEGITHVTATVLSANRALLAMVQRMGWQTVVTLDGCYADLVATLPHQQVEAGGELRGQRSR
jgi:GNAT superfamily N-acetyltransferase